MKKQTKKSATIRAVEIMKLAFFANRFGIAKSQLTWGIVVSENEDAQVSISAAVLVKEKSLFIDILNDRLTPLMNICGCKSTSYVAVFNRVRSGYKFTAGNEAVFLSNEQIERVYRSKCYSEALAAEAARLNK